MTRTSYTFRCSALCCQRYARLIGTADQVLSLAREFGWRIVVAKASRLPRLVCSASCETKYWIEQADMRVGPALRRMSG